MDHRDQREEHQDETPRRIVKRTITEEVFEEVESTHQRPTEGDNHDALDDAECDEHPPRRRR